MPHFILDSSTGVLEVQDKTTIMQAVFSAAEESGLFDVNDIKVRIRTYSDYITGRGTDDDFIHVFGYILEGRTATQKNALSRAIVGTLKDLLPDVPIVSMNVMEFEKATYNNRHTL